MKSFAKNHFCSSRTAGLGVQTLLNPPYRYSVAFIY